MIHARTAPWDEPVTYETDKLGKYWTVSSTAEAARALLERWPVKSGDAWFAAQAACLEVLEGKAPVAVARDAFLKAAAEADVFVRS